MGRWLLKLIGSALTVGGIVVMGDSGVTLINVLGVLSGLGCLIGGFVGEERPDVILLLNSDNLPRFQVLNRGKETARDIEIVYPPNFPLHERDRAEIPKVLKGGESASVLVALDLGRLHEYDFEWSWRYGLWPRTHRKSKVGLH